MSFLPRWIMSYTVKIQGSNLVGSVTVRAEQEQTARKLAAATVAKGLDFIGLPLEYGSTLAYNPGDVEILSTEKEDIVPPHHTKQDSTGEETKTVTDGSGKSLEVGQDLAGQLGFVRWHVGGPKSKFGVWHVVKVGRTHICGETRCGLEKKIPDNFVIDKVYPTEGGRCKVCQGML